MLQFRLDEIDAANEEESEDDDESEEVLTE